MYFESHQVILYQTNIVYQTKYGFMFISRFNKLIKLISCITFFKYVGCNLIANFHKWKFLSLLGRSYEIDVAFQGLWFFSKNSENTKESSNEKVSSSWKFRILGTVPRQGLKVFKAFIKPLRYHKEVWK